LHERFTRDGRHIFEARMKVAGKSIRHRLASTTATDAIREQRRWVAERDAGVRLVGRSDMTVRELRGEWERWARSPASSYAARTIESYLDALDRRVLRILGPETKAASVQPPHLRALIDTLCAEGLAGSTVHGAVTATSALLRFGVRRGVIESNPTRLLERGDKPSAKRRREPRYLDRAQIDDLLANLGDEFRPVAATLAFAGLRVSEGLALRWQDVDFDAAILDVRGTKTVASAQPVPLISDLAAELRAHRSRQASVSLLRIGREALVFVTASGRPQDRHNAARAIRAAGDAANLNTGGGKKVAPHDLRHSCAALLLGAGVPAPKVAAILRHSDARVTLSFYAGIVENQRADLRADLEQAFS
jgi:integrase